MRYEDERYVRLYTRDTATWIAIGWEGRHVLMSLLRKVDRAGVLDVLEGEEVDSIAQLIMAPVEIVAAGLNKLVERRVVKIEAGQVLWPKFLEAQECRTSDKERQRKHRELASLGSGAVTGGHTASQIVTPSRAVPSRAVPSRTVPSLGDPAPGKGRKPKPVQPDLPAIPPAPPAPASPPRELTPVQAAYGDYQLTRRIRLTDPDYLGLEFVPDEDPNWPRIATALGPILKACEPHARDGISGWERLLAIWFGLDWAAGMSPPFPFNAFASPKIQNGDPDQPKRVGLMTRLAE